MVSGRPRLWGSNRVPENGKGGKAHAKEGVPGEVVGQTSGGRPRVYFLGVLPLGLVRRGRRHHQTVFFIG